MRVLFKAKLIGTEEWVQGTYHYSNDNMHHYILNREKFLERDGEMSLHSQEVHIVDVNSLTQINDDSDNWDELKAEIKNKSMFAKEIADDVQQTFDGVTNSYRQKLEDRIANLITTSKLPSEEQIYQYATDKAKGFERETLARQCFFEGAMWLRGVLLIKKEYNCTTTGLGKDKYYSGDCDIHKPCPQCLGSGKAMNIKYDLPCQRCNGEGEI